MQLCTRARQVLWGAARTGRGRDGQPAHPRGARARPYAPVRTFLSVSLPERVELRRRLYLRITFTSPAHATFACCSHRRRTRPFAYRNLRYGSCHAVAGLDVDEDVSFDKFHIRHRVNGLLKVRPRLGEEECYSPNPLGNSYYRGRCQGVATVKHAEVLTVSSRQRVSPMLPVCSSLCGPYATCETAPLLPPAVRAPQEHPRRRGEPAG